MKARMLTFVCAALVLAWSTASFSEPQLASAADGKAMLDRAIAALKANEAAALKAFNDEKNKDFRDRDLYVYCFSLPDGNFTAYQSPVMIGTNIKELKVPPNDPVGQRAYNAVAKAAEGEIVTFTYNFPKPGTKASAPKETLEVRVGKQACGVSYFKSQKAASFREALLSWFFSLGAEVALPFRHCEEGNGGANTAGAISN